MSNFPGYKPLPFLGNLDFLRKPPQEYLLDCFEKYGTPFKIKIFNMNIIVFSDSEINEFVLQDNDNRFSSQMGWFFLRRNLGDGILLQDGARHRKTRKFIGQAFHKSILQRYTQLIPIVLNTKLSKIKINSFHCSSFFHRLTFEIGCTLILGIKNINDIDTLYPLFRDFVKGTTSISTYLNLKLPTTKYGRAVIAKKKLSNFLIQEIEERSLNNIQASSMLDIFIKAKLENSEFTNDEIVTNILQLLFAARDTTAQQLCWAMYELSKNPNISESLRAESSIFLGSNNLQLSNFRHNLLFDSFLKEIERFYPPIFVIPRGVKKSFQYKNYVIPEGHHINLSPFLTHRSEQYYLHPSRFDAKRFLGREISDMHPYSLIGFGAGVHRCLGEELARLEMKLILGTFLQQYTWRLPTDVDLPHKPDLDHYHFLKAFRLSLTPI